MTGGTFNKYDRSINPDWEPDAHVELYLLPTEQGGKASGVDTKYQPNYKIMDDYLTSTFHFFIDCEYLKPGERCEAFVKFITPEAYPNSIHEGSEIKVQEGSRLVGHAKILDVYNALLKSN